MEPLHIVAFFYWLGGLISFVWIKGSVGDDVPSPICLLIAVLWPVVLLFGLGLTFVMKVLRK